MNSIFCNSNFYIETDKRPKILFIGFHPFQFSLASLALILFFSTQVLWAQWDNATLLPNIINTNIAGHVLLSNTLPSSLLVGYDAVNVPIPLERIHIYDPNRATLRLSTDVIITVGGTQAINANLSMVSSAFPNVYSTLSTPGDVVLANSDKGEDIILTTRSRTGNIRLATTDPALATDNERFVVFPDGNVLVGTRMFPNQNRESIYATGTARLDIQEPSRSKRAFAVEDGSINNIFIVPNLETGRYNQITQVGDIGIFFAKGDVDNAGTPGSLVIAPWSNNEESGIRITSDGNVGIGVHNPQQKLVVNGKICAQE